MTTIPELVAMIKTRDEVNAVLVAALLGKAAGDAYRLKMNECDLVVEQMARDE